MALSFLANADLPHLAAGFAFGALHELPWIAGAALAAFLLAGFLRKLTYEKRTRIAKCFLQLHFYEPDLMVIFSMSHSEQEPL